MSFETVREGDLLTRIESGLERAVREAEELSWEHGTNIKKQKYADLAVNHFSTGEEPPLTKSWFKYGVTLPAAPAGSSRVPSFDGVPTIDTEDRLFEMSEEEFQHFFQNIVTNPPLNRKFWFKKDVLFLREYYKYHAPEWLLQIYLENLSIRLTFWNIKEDLRALIDTQETAARSLQEFGGESVHVDYRRQFGRNGSEFLLQMSSHSEFDSVIPMTEQFVKFVEGVLLKLYTLDEEELSDQHLSVVDDIYQDLYDGYVWEAIASVISMNTAEGPNADVLETLAEENAAEYVDGFEDTLDHFERECEDANLIPSPLDYGNHHEAGETVDSLFEVIDAEARIEPEQLE